MVQSLLSGLLWINDILLWAKVREVMGYEYKYSFISVFLILICSNLMTHAKTSCGGLINTVTCILEWLFYVKQITFYDHVFDFFSN